jgi:hypothetical protein
MQRILFIVVFFAIFEPMSLSAQQIDDGLAKVFYAGAYYDVPPAGGNETSKYLVGPLVRKVSNFSGDELYTYVEDAMRANTAFSTAVAVSFGADAQLGKDGGGLAVYIPRAQHDQVKYSVPGAPDIYLTTISISVALDVFTDKAAESRFLQLEGLYSRLLVGEQSVKTRAPLDDAALASHYASLFNQTLSDLLNDAANDHLGRQREKANAMFQLSEFIMPKGDKFPAEIAQLIGSGSDVERLKLSLEFLHLINKTVSDEFNKKSHRDIALLSPPTAWAVSNVGELLAKRLVGKSRGGSVKIRFFADPNAEQAVDTRGGGKMGPVAYTVKPALARASTKVLAESEIQKAKIFGVQLLARIYLPQFGQAPKWVPVTVPEEARTAKGMGGADIDDVAGMERVTTREIAMSAMRSAAKDLAPGLVDLMRNIADNRVENR